MSGSWSDYERMYLFSLLLTGVMIFVVLVFLVLGMYDVSSMAMYGALFIFLYALYTIIVWESRLLAKVYDKLSHSEQEEVKRVLGLIGFEKLIEDERYE